MYVFVFKFIVINIVEIFREWCNGFCWVYLVGGGVLVVCFCYVVEWYLGSI